MSHNGRPRYLGHALHIQQQAAYSPILLKEVDLEVPNDMTRFGVRLLSYNEALRLVAHT